MNNVELGRDRFGHNHLGILCRFVSGRGYFPTKVSELS